MHSKASDSSKELTPAAQRKVSSVKAVASQGLPPQYANSFEWARDWCRENGMTLPPDTDALRSLRNWFCFKLNQYKKGKLGEKNEALLAHYELDFSQYEALKTGKGERASDRPSIEALQAVYQSTGSYDLNDDAPAHLVEWQDKLLNRFEADGMSRRMKDLLRDLPGLHFGLWMRPRDMAPSDLERTWWAKAYQYEVLAERFPARAGLQHPGMPAAMQDWATHQQALAAQGLLPKRANGWMRGIGLLVNVARARVGAERMQAALALSGGQDYLNSYGVNDRRLSSIRGALAAINAVQKGRSDQALMVEFAIDPPTAVALRKHIDKRRGDTRWPKDDMNTCRMIALNADNAFSPHFWRFIENYPDSRPAGMTPRMEALGRLAWSITKTFGDRTITPTSLLASRGATPPTRSTIGSRMEIPPRGDGELLFMHVAQEWLDANQAKWSKVTHGTTTSIVHKWLLPGLGHMPMSSLREADITEHIGSLSTAVSSQWRPLSAKSISNVNMALTGILQFGTERYGLAPLDRAKLPHVTVQSKQPEIDPFTKSESLLLLELVREDFSGYLHAAMFSGLTGSELVDLQWDAIDWKHARIRLVGSRGEGDSHEDWDDQEPPSARSRTVEIGDSWQQALLTQFQRSGAGGGAVFVTAAGTRLDPKNMTERLWWPLLRYAGLRRRGPRQLRHTAALFWLDEGKSEEWIAQQMGLPSAETVRKRYHPLLKRFREDPLISATVTSSQKPARMPSPSLRGVHHPNYRSVSQTGA